MAKKKKAHTQILKKRGGSGTSLGNTPTDPNLKSDATTAKCRYHIASNPGA